MENYAKRNSSSRHGVILLVVLGSLTFFSILVAAYLVFSNESRDASFARSQQEIRDPDVDWIMNEALMKLVRGTGNPYDPFYGEDLLSDYYGLGDACEVQIVGKQKIDQLVELRLQIDGEPPAHLKEHDGVFAGLIITLPIDSDTPNRSYRITSSRHHNGNQHDVIMKLDDDEVFDKITSDKKALINGRPRNGKSASFKRPTAGDSEKTKYAKGDINNWRGFDGVPKTDPMPVRMTLPVALQPNHVLGQTDNKFVSEGHGDYDEDYDAPDFNNWFLSHRLNLATGEVIPSFHRPSVINYLLNQSEATNQEKLLSSIRRATFRPLPFRHSGANYDNGGFTGGNANYGLRVPYDATKSISSQRMHQLFDALINGEWDVDNDSDGKPDSIWVDLGIPEFVTREGKLIKPLVAPMIEDLGNRLNLNAHSNVNLKQLANVAGTVPSDNVYWALDPNLPLNRLFRGIGWGPADIALPQMTGEDGLDLIDKRYGYAELQQKEVPGAENRDPLDVLRSGFRPQFHTGDSGFGYTTDPFGNAAVGIGNSGHVLSAQNRFAPDDREDQDHPYEMDPRGQLAGDNLFRFADLEPILRSADFDSELLPPQIRKQLRTLVSAKPNYRHSLTTRSSSDDSPVVSLLDLILDRYPDACTNAPGGQAVGLKKLIPTESRLGRKLDVNRSFGNLVDDSVPNTPGYGVIDEPKEVQYAFRDRTGTDREVPAGFDQLQPAYNWDNLNETNYPDRPEGHARQILARHLYVLLMALRPQLVDGSKATLPMIGDSTQSELYTARRLAQWAVNVVDYRDPDSIMTRFAFDPYPFDLDGWSVEDGSQPLGPNETWRTQPASSEYVVWGVEEPQLLFSEGLAFHDVRVRDTERDAAEKFKLDDPDDDQQDPNTDQVRIPQGSLFLELYCPHPVPRTPNGRGEPGFPREFYEFPNGAPRLKLDQTHNGQPQGTPVWRIAISEKHSDPDKSKLSPLEIRAQNLDSASFELDQVSDELSAQSDELTSDRFIWFIGQTVDVTNNVASSQDLYNWIDGVIGGNGIGKVHPQLPAGNPQGMSADQVFLAPNLTNLGEGVDPITQNRYLQPGQFLVLAPRRATYLGSRFQLGNPNSNAGGNGNGNAFGLRNNISPSGRSHQSLIFDPTYGIRHTDMEGNLLNRDLNRSFGSVANIMLLSAPRPSGFSPASYRDGLVGLNISEPMPWSGDYYPAPTQRYFGNGNDVLAREYDLLDAYTDMSLPFDPALPAPTEPLDVANPHLPQDGLGEPLLGTLTNYRTAYLQRLADPTQVYHPITNPYRTVDWLPLDLTVFSGEEKEGVVKNTPDNRGEAIYARRSRQRNGLLKRPSSNTVDATNVLFTTETHDTNSEKQKIDPTGFTDGEGEFFSFDQRNGGGHLYTSLNFLNTEHPTLNPNFVGFAAPLGADGVGMNANLPSVPYATHPWLNRPFASDHELMLVPACSASRLVEEFSIPKPIAGPLDVYAPATDTVTARGGCRHLLNFFYNGSTDHINDLELVRLFEFVGTLPRFRGEIDYQRLNQTTMNSLPIYSPPFNFFYDNQRQATVNLNTLATAEVWQGLMQGHLEDLENDQNLRFDLFRLQRQGYADRPANPGNPGSSDIRYRSDLDPDLPTRFAGVYRSSFHAGFASSDPLFDDGSSDLIPSIAALERSESDVSLLRNRSIKDDPPSGQSVFVRPFASASHPARNHSRNAMLQYQTVMRMPNLVSDNSQVFLIRLTVGFFEVDPSTKGLGQEYNAETGSSKRYKATFVVDRSIPVGFEPGKDLNARDVVVFESYGQ